jgi:DNA-binding IclR family transcriptional regulator
MQSEGVKKNQSLGKALQIIETMAEHCAPMRLQELSGRLEMNESTVLRFLNTLIDYGYVKRLAPGGKYSLTLKLAQLGSRIHTGFPYQRVLHPYLEELSRELLEPVSLTVEQDGNVVYIDTVDGPDHMLRTLQRIGKVAPMHSTAAGKLLLLNYGEDLLKDFIEKKGLPSFTEKTITRPVDFISELETVKKRGYAYDNEECEVGVKCIAFPVRDFSGKNVAAISISAPMTRFTPEKEQKILRVLEYVTRRASTELGWNPHEIAGRQEQD